MATSIDDLLAALDQQSRRSSALPTDAGYALEWCALMLTRLRSDSVGTGLARHRDDAVRRLADACSQASIAFERGHGRASELAAVTSDAVGRIGNELTDCDRWAIAVRLAAPTRLWAGVIAHSGPYAEAPQLLSVADRGRELLRVAAAARPELAELRGIDQPIPTSEPIQSVPTTTDITEATARLVGELRRCGRDPMSTRELVAVCHAAGRVAECVEMVAGNADDRGRWACPWRTARDTMALYTDGMRSRVPGNPRSRILDIALRVDIAVRHAEVSPRQAGTRPRPCPDHHEVTRLARSLHQAARGCVIEFDRIKNNLFVPPGGKPLSENRVGEWLRHEPFVVQPADLVPGTESLRQANEASIDLIRRTQLSARSTSEPPGPSAKHAMLAVTL